MKMAGSYGFLLATAVMGIVLIGNRSVQSEEIQAQPDVTDTNLLSAVETHAPLAVTLPSDIDPDSAYDELVRLVQAGVDQSVILTYIENSLRFFNLDADRIIYLADLGTPSEIIEAAMEHDKQLLQEGISPAASPSAEETEAMTNPPPEVTEDYLYDTLSPYGTWVYVEGYGRCWRPTVVTYRAGWRPYCDNGRWVYTDYGWYWMSDYSWGWAAFHYGRWFRHDRYGWCWWPDTVWSPSWVSWRYDRTYCGWAPLPPYTSCRSGAGIVYRGTRVSVGFNFGLDSDCYTFIATRNFCDPKPSRHYVDRREAKRIYDRTKVFNRIDYDIRKKSVVNGGISPNIISTLSGQDIATVSVRHTGSRAGNNNRHEQLNRDARTLVVSRPDRAVPQNKQSPARRSSSAQQTDPPQKSRTFAATGGRNHHTPGRETVDTPAGRVQSSGTRQPTPAPQTRQQQSTPPPAGTTSQRDSKGTSNRSSSAASGRIQAQRRNARPKGPQSGKSNDAARGNIQSTPAQSDVADEGQ